MYVAIHELQRTLNQTGSSTALVIGGFQGEAVKDSKS